MAVSYAALLFFQFKLFDNLGLKTQHTDVLHKQFAFNSNDH